MTYFEQLQVGSIPTNIHITYKRKEKRKVKDFVLEI